MTHIKKMVIQGFKSFANKTEVLFDQGINVIVGPNGSGKSNVSDALCFALGRLSLKSIRAAKAKNLLFMGSKYVKPAREASVELIFDNEKKTFSYDTPEVTLTRIVRFNGQSIYKINNETKTRNEVVELLAQAGIDPYGFNIVLQGQIQAIVRVHPDERRKIIEEVAGIAIYESRKEKSIKELEKTEERLKEITAILRERTAFLKNLERERSAALRFQELELIIKRCKASLINKKIEDKTKELTNFQKSIDEKSSHREKIKVKVEKLQKEIEELTEKISQINKHIQKSAGVEQENLREQIATLRAEIEVLKVRKENYENRARELSKRIEALNLQIPEYEIEIETLKKETPLVAKKQAELQKKKNELEKIEEERKSIYSLRSEIQSLRERLKDKESQKARISMDTDAILRQIEQGSTNLLYADITAAEKAFNLASHEVKSKKERLTELSKNELESTRHISAADTMIRNAEKIREQVSKIDVCPLCQNKMTQEHLKHVNDDCDTKLSEARKTLDHVQKTLNDIKKEREVLHTDIAQLEKKAYAAEREITVHKQVKSKRDDLKRLVDLEKDLAKEIEVLKQKREMLENKSSDTSAIEEKYRAVLMEIEEISSRTTQDLDTSLLYKSRELEKARESLKLAKKDAEEMIKEVKDIVELTKIKVDLLTTKVEEEERLSEKFKQLFTERDKLQEVIQQSSFDASSLQSEMRQIEDQGNFLKVGFARIDAEKQALEMEMTEFKDLEFINGSANALQERLDKAQSDLRQIGSINMRALEVYDEIKKQYDEVQEKVNTLSKEKEEIMNIIAEIDNKKKRTFMKTFTGISDLFSRNFSSLSTKGQAFLEIENKDDIFAGGVNIVIRMGKGKYFDVTSLSGGEQTLIALSLLFAIQEYKPYHFYVFDEIDAALDKRNSERLSALLKQYMKSGQYIVVTHNDAIILDSDVLYGVSMHDGVSKVLSLKIKDKKA